MAEFLTPGVSFEFLDTAPAVGPLRTDIVGFVGLAERGPLDEPVRIDSWRQFQARFGGFVPWAYLGWTVKAFFENGGRCCYVVRVAGRDPGGAKAASLSLRDDAGKDAVSLVAREPGTWGRRLAVSLRAVSGDRLVLAVTRDGGEREVLADLPVAAKDFADKINGGPGRPGSRWLMAELLNAGKVHPGQSGLEGSTCALKGGCDGLASLRAADFIGVGATATARGRGLGALARVDAVSVVCVPDIHVRPEPPAVTSPPPPQPPVDPCGAGQASASPAAAAAAAPPDALHALSEEDVRRVQRAMIEHCEGLRDRVAILDAPEDPPGRPRTVQGVLEWRKELASDRGFAALYYPWVRMADPSASAGRLTHAVPPCGHVAGVYARGDLAVGVHKAPANEELAFAEDVTTAIDDDTQGILNPEGVNCIRAYPGRGIRIHGARTLSGDSDWRYVNVRRLMLMIEAAVEEATQWAVFEPHGGVLRDTLAASVRQFLTGLWKRGALKGASADEAFRVRCDDGTHAPGDTEAGRLVVEVAVAPARPAEFIVFRVGRTVEELERVER